VNDEPKVRRRPGEHAPRHAAEMVTDPLRADSALSALGPASTDGSLVAAGSRTVDHHLDDGEEIRLDARRERMLVVKALMSALVVAAIVVVRVVYLGE
jgi:hypothetical protein